MGRKIFRVVVTYVFLLNSTAAIIWQDTRLVLVRDSIAGYILHDSDSNILTSHINVLQNAQ